MFVAGNFLMGIAQVLDLGPTAYQWIIIARAILSWVNPDPYNPIVRFLYNVTEPVLYRVRRTLPFAYVSGLDLSPLIVLAAILFAKIFVVQSLMQIATQLR